MPRIKNRPAGHPQMRAIKQLRVDQEAIEMAARGKGKLEIAQAQKRSVRAVAASFHRALKTSSFPSTLTGKEVDTLRQSEGETLRLGRQYIFEALDTASRDLTDPDPNVRLKAATAIAMTNNSLVKSIDTESAIFDTRTPISVVSEQYMRLELQQDQNFHISFDDSFLIDPRDTVPGMQIYEGGNQERLVEGSDIQITDG
jgi:hypothetical protein